MIDYAIQPNGDMIKLYNYCKLKNVEFFWIDHHITAIENIGVDAIPGLVDDTVCGSFNTWLFMMEQEKKIETAPKILKMVNDLDTWNRKNTKFSWNDEILPITYYINSLGSELNDNNSELVQFFKNSFNDSYDMSNELRIGNRILNYVKTLERQNLKKIYQMEWNGYNCLVLNTTLIGSMQFEQHPDFNNVDLCITWSYDGKYYYYGMYSTKSNIDVGDLCQTFLNGGGHKSCRRRPFKGIYFKINEKF